jgi:hypothetical protein
LNTSFGASTPEHGVVDDDVAEGQPERQPVLVEGDNPDHHEEVEVGLDHPAGQVDDDGRGGDQSEHGRRRPGPPADGWEGGGQREHRHQRRLLKGVGHAHAPGDGEGGDAGHVQPQQPDDPPGGVAPRPRA